MPNIGSLCQLLLKNMELILLCSLFSLNFPIFYTMILCSQDCSCLSPVIMFITLLGLSSLYRWVSCIPPLPFLWPHLLCLPLSGQSYSYRRIFENGSLILSSPRVFAFSFLTYAFLLCVLWTSNSGRSNSYSWSFWTLSHRLLQ